MNASTRPDCVELTNVVTGMFFFRMNAARKAGITAEAAQQFIQTCREFLTEEGCTKRDIDSVFCQAHWMIHWEWDQPTDRIFETLLDFELTEFWTEKGIAGDYDATNVS